MVIKRLFNRRGATRSEPRAAPRVPDGQCFVAVGDIHGRRDLLDDLLARIAADDRLRAAPPATLVFLGDLINRGDDSADVIDRLLALRRARHDTRVLMGNHEELLRKALDGDVPALRVLDRNGGRETAISYGIDADTFRTADFAELADLLRAAIPPAHRAFLDSLEDMVVVGDYAFVHAGIDPDVPLSEQTPRALRWIRGRFLDAPGPFEKVIVHGHTPVPDVDILAHRIALDTGAYATGVLSAMAFVGAERWVIQTGG